MRNPAWGKVSFCSQLYIYQMPVTIYHCQCINNYFKFFVDASGLVILYDPMSTQRMASSGSYCSLFYLEIQLCVDRSQAGCPSTSKTDITTKLKCSRW